MYVIADPSNRVDVGLVVRKVERVDVVCTKVKKKNMTNTLALILFVFFSAQVSSRKILDLDRQNELLYAISQSGVIDVNSR